MKVSSLTGNSIESGLMSQQQASTLYHAIQSGAATLVKTIDRIGTAIALGEAGDLDAAHEFRNQDHKAK